MHKVLSLSITKEDVDLYNGAYFKAHPKAKKAPIDRPIHPSINRWMIIKNRAVMNGLKQNWKEFAKFWCERHGVNNLGLSDYVLEMTMYMPNKRRADPDNYTPKFLLDGFVESGFLVDDDGNHMRALILKTDYDKINYRTEIKIKIYDKNEAKEKTDETNRDIQIVP